ncbi:MAG: DUF2304 domain-containing protein [Lachnospiraceae bacterium]|nr:DUF2304 domain-containing protein [Lachnospiraceae bacterium]
MIPATLRITLISAVICYFIVILYFLKQKALNLKYTLLWLVAGVVMGILVAVPELLMLLIHIFGIQDNMNGLFIFAIGFMIMILLSLTSIASRQNRKIRTLTQELAILDKRVRELEQETETGK